MNVDTIISLGPELIVAVICLGLLAGFVKGCVGFAMPMILISGLGAILPAEAALAGLILPTLIANLWQAFRNGLFAAVHSAWAHWRYLAVLLVGIGIGAQFVTVLPGSTLFLVIGVPVVFFAALQLVGWRPTINADNRTKAEIGIGSFSGILGGVSGVWGPPTVLYLTALNTPKVEQMRVQGVIYGGGAVMLTLAHIQSGILNASSFQLSVLVLLPALFGMGVGFAVQDKMDQQKFRRFTLAVLIIAGLNLVRRGVMG